MVAYLGVINLLIAVFNLLPGFPLDGGRILRSLAWGTTKNFALATRIAARTGQFKAFLMVSLGFVHMFMGNILGGIWVSFVGWFLFTAATGSHREVPELEAQRKAAQAQPLPEPIPLFPDGVPERAQEAAARERKAA